MTHDPRLPTLEQIMNGNPFELIDTPWGKLEAWRASTLATGTMGAFQSVHDVVRADAAAATARADATEALATLVKHVCDKIAEFERRFDAHVAHVARFADDAKRRADEQAREAAFAEEPLAFPPEPDGPDIIEDETHSPGGELHSLPPKDQELESELPEPPLKTEADMGGVPLSYKSVPTSYVRGGPKDQAGDLPEELEEALPEPEPEPKGSVYPQPTAISLNEE